MELNDSVNELELVEVDLKKIEGFEKMMISNNSITTLTLSWCRSLEILLNIMKENKKIHNLSIIDIMGSKMKVETFELICENNQLKNLCFMCNRNKNLY